MKKGLTELVFILDKSGSMHRLESDTIGGFNSTLEKQKKVEGECIVTTVLFNEKSKLLHDRTDIRAVNPITEEEYSVGGNTALLDAVGKTIAKISSAQRYTAEDYRAEHVIFTIITDGYENASYEYSYKKVKELIEQKKECGWQFIFLGANIDVAETAEKMGIDRDCAAEFTADSIGVRKNFNAVNSHVCYMRSPSLSPERVPNFAQRLKNMGKEKDNNGKDDESKE